MVGTKSGDIYGITEKSSSSQVVVNSHTEGEIWGLCAHPEKDVFVTGSDDKTVRLWDLSKKVSIMLSQNIYLKLLFISSSSEILLVSLICK